MHQGTTDIKTFQPYTGSLKHITTSEVIVADAGYGCEQKITSTCTIPELRVKMKYNYFYKTCIQNKIQSAAYKEEDYIYTQLTHM